MRRRRRGDDTRISFFSFQDIITSLAGIMIFIALMLVLDMATTALTPPAVREPDAEAPTTRLAADEAPLRAEAATAEAARLRDRLDDVRRQSRELAARSAQVAAIDPQAAAREIRGLEEKLRRIAAEGQSRSEQRRNQEAELLRLGRERDDLQREIKGLAVAKRTIEKTAGRVVFTLPGDRDEKKDVVVIELAGQQILLGRLSTGRVASRIADLSSGARLRQLGEGLRRYPPDQFDVLALYKPSAFDDRLDFVDFVRGLGYRVGYEPLEEDRSTMDDERGG